MQEIKNILIVTGIFPPDIGGPATYGATIESALKNAVLELRWRYILGQAEVFPRA